jgi:group I intron endonuclease
MSYYYVYKTINLINGKYYIGAHKSDTPHDLSYVGSGTIIKKAIEKYGVDNFINGVIDYYPDKSSMFEAEKLIVGDLWQTDPLCYNQSPGGYGGSGVGHVKDMTWHKKPKPDDVKKKISKSLSGKSYITEEGRRKCSEASKGNQHALGLRYSGKHSEEGKKRIGESTSKRFKGTKLSKEHKEKLAEVRSRIPNPMESDANRRKIAESKIGLKRLTKDGKFKMAKPGSDKWNDLIKEGYINK